MEIETQRHDISPFQTFVVTPDYETDQILNGRPKEILNHLFNNDPLRVFLLEGTGFSMEAQLQTWINGYKEAIETGGDLQEAQMKFVQRTIRDVVGFYYEYLSGQDIFPIEVEFQQKEDGEKTVYATRYGKSLENITQENERDGSMARGIKKVVEILKESGPETVVILNSPAGWSGLSRDNKPVFYPDNQSYVYWINKDGNLDAMTIRTKIGLETAEVISGIEGRPHMDTIGRIKSVVETPVPVDAKNFEEVLDLIEKTSGFKYPKIRREIENRNSLFELNDQAASIILDLKVSLEENTSPLNLDNIKYFAIMVGKAVLDLSDHALENKLLKTNKPRLKVANGGDASHVLSRYYNLRDLVKQIPGCNGGGVEADTASNDSVLAQISERLQSGKVCRMCGTSENVACGWCTPCYIRSKRGG